MRFEWDQDKAHSNLKKHSVSFEAAAHVFTDALAISKHDDRYPDERWVTIGASGARVLYVAHTIKERQEEITIRIISARKTTSRERRFYVDHSRTP